MKEEMCKLLITKTYIHMHMFIYRKSNIYLHVVILFNNYYIFDYRRNDLIIQNEDIFT